MFITVNVIRSLKSYQKYFMTELSKPLTQAHYTSEAGRHTSLFGGFRQAHTIKTG